MQALQSGHRVSELPPTFPCAECGQTIVHTLTTGGTGYAVRASDYEMICYDCATANELDHAATTGKLFAYVHGIEYHRSHYAGIRRMPIYVVTTAKHAAITTWPGNVLSVGPIRTGTIHQSNLGDVRIPITCLLPTSNRQTSTMTWDGNRGDLELWSGTYYASAGDYCRLSRNKIQLLNQDSRT